MRREKAVQPPQPDSSLKRTLLLSDNGMVYKEVEQGITLFVVQFTTWYYLYRYRRDMPLRFIDRHIYGTLTTDLRECRIEIEQGWTIGEEYPVQEVVLLLLHEIEAQRGKRR